MAKHTVDTSLNTKPVSVPAEQADYLPKMPLARGNAKAGDPVPQNQPVSSSVTVSGVPQDDGNCPEPMPVPASSVFTPPPARVGRPSEPMPNPQE
jgi:hypothetical protein